MFSSREHDPGRRQFLKGAAVAVGALAIGLGSRTGESGETLYDDNFIYNPDKLNIIPIQEINQFRNYLETSRWQESVTKVRVYPINSLIVDSVYGSISGGKPANALYVKENRTVCVSNSESVDMGTLWHELGHGILYAIEHLRIGMRQDESSKESLYRLFRKQLIEAALNHEADIIYSGTARDIFKGLSQDIGRLFWSDFLANASNKPRDYGDIVVLADAYRFTRDKKPGNLFRLAVDKEASLSKATGHRLDNRFFSTTVLGSYMISTAIKSPNGDQFEIVEPSKKERLIDMVARLDANIFVESFADTYMNYRLGKTASMPKEVLANIRQFS